MATYDVNKLTKLGALKQLAERVKEDFTSKEEFEEVSGEVALLGTSVSTLQGKVETLEEAEGEKNVIEEITVNNEKQSVVGKSVNITVPKSTSELTNDAGFKNETEVKGLVDSGINDFATKVSNNDVVDTFKELVDYVAAHGEEAADMAADILKNTGAIEDLEALVGEDSVSEQIEEALGDYVQKDGDKVLSTNDYTTADKAKLDAIDYASEADISAMLDEVFATED